MSNELILLNHGIQTVISQLASPLFFDGAGLSRCNRDSDSGMLGKQAQSHTRAALPVVTNPDAGGEDSFDTVVASGASMIVFDGLNTTYNYNDGLTATGPLDVIGNGVDDMTLSGGNLYLAGYETLFCDLTLNGQIFGGGTASTGVVLCGDISLTFSDSDFTNGNRIYGGSEVVGSATAITGGIMLAMTYVDGNGARVFGAGKVAGKANMIVGDIEIAVSCTEGGSFSNLFAGADVVAGYTGTVVCGEVNTIIDGGTFTYCGNGSQLRSGASVQKGATLTVNGGTFNHYVYAGGFSAGGTVSVNGDTSLIINGGTFAAHVFGGCGANNSENGGKTLVSGTAGVFVNSSKTSVTFNGSVFAGSLGYGNISGGTFMSFTGLGSNLHFSANSYITGNSQMFRGAFQFVGGNQTLKFDGFNGNFGANVNNGFSRLVVQDSNVSFTGSQVVLGGISAWEIEIGSAAAELVIENVKNNFKGDTLVLTLAEGAAPSTEGWDVIAGTKDALNGWKAFSAVSLCGEDALYANGEWSNENYRLFNQGNILKMATIA